MTPPRRRRVLWAAAIFAALSAAAWGYLTLTGFNDSLGMSSRTAFLFHNLHPVRHLVLTTAVPVCAGLAAVSLVVALFLPRDSRDRRT